MKQKEANNKEILKAGVDRYEQVSSEVNELLKSLEAK